MVSQLLVCRHSDPLDRLTPRDREVFAKLDPPEADADHRRELAVLRFLGVA